MESIILGGGCFWCTEAVFQCLKGVKKVTPGYMGGTVPGTPTYREVRSGRTGHVEVVRVDFDPLEINLGELVMIFMKSHDPTSLDQQGADVGSQYRSIIFYWSLAQAKIIHEVIGHLQEQHVKPIVTQVLPAKIFHPAEVEHQDYFNRNPGMAYCQLVIAPKIKEVQVAHPQYIKPKK